VTEREELAAIIWRAMQESMKAESIRIEQAFEYADKYLKESDKRNEIVTAENFVCDCCGENPCQCGEDTTVAEVYSVHYAGI
jgi:hypothetical protein